MEETGRDEHLFWLPQMSQAEVKQATAKSDKYASFDVKCRLGDSPCGLGLFANQAIKKGTLVWTNRSHLNSHIEIVSLTKAKIAELPADTQALCLRYMRQDADDSFAVQLSAASLTQDAFNYLNHSCEPNLWFVTDNHLFACRDIQEGDELCFDYGTGQTVFSSFDVCKCGSKTCRKEVKATDYRLPELRRSMGSHFRFHVLQRIEAENKVVRAREAKETSASVEPTFTTVGDDKIIELTDETRGEGLLHEMHRSIEVRGSAMEGRGLFATRFLPKGTVVWEARESEDDIWMEVEAKDLSSFDAEMQRLITYYFEMNLETKRFRGPRFPECIERDASNFYNHSCKPNNWFISDSKIVAMRDIQAGDELCYDYATSKPLVSSSFTCRCGNKECRNSITHDDYKLKNLQALYGNHWVSYYLKLFKASSK